MTATATERDAFADAVGRAVDERAGFAAGKLGGTEQNWMMLPVVAREGDSRRAHAFAVATAHRGLRHAGVFPADAAFAHDFAARFADAVRRFDSLGVTDDVPSIDRIVVHHGLDHPVHFSAHEPDRSSPADDASCWLHHLRGRRVLIVCPFADLLAERATRETFEAVWAKTGKRWFEPASVSGIELPYGFEPATQRRFDTCLDLLDDVCARIDATDYDVALIAVGGLGALIAAHVKARGRVGISLGGHLQALFGVLGERWRKREEWQRSYINDAWIDMPARYRPDSSLTDEDYW